MELHGFLACNVARAMSIITQQFLPLVLLSFGVCSIIRKFGWRIYIRSKLHLEYRPACRLEPLAFPGS